MAGSRQITLEEAINLIELHYQKGVNLNKRNRVRKPPTQVIHEMIYTLKNVPEIYSINRLSTDKKDVLNGIGEYLLKISGVYPILALACAKHYSMII